MTQTNKERVMNYLEAIAPDYATNADIREATGIRPHQQVYMLTQELCRVGRVEASRRGREWVFRAKLVPVTKLETPSPTILVETPLRTVTRAASEVEDITPATFEAMASSVMSRHFNMPLRPGQVDGVPKRFDYVSPDGQIIGDAKYYTLVRGERLPPAKFSVIAEHVWLLEKTGAPTTFLVFGNDRRVPELWLACYSDLVEGVQFYFLSADGELSRLTKGPR